MTIPYNFDPLGSSNMPTYDPGTILIKQSGEYTYNIKLSRGVYKIALCGAGGTGTDFSGSAPEGASVSLYDSWGTGREVNSNPGGLRVEYLRYS